MTSLAGMSFGAVKGIATNAALTRASIALAAGLIIGISVGGNSQAGTINIDAFDNGNYGLRLDTGEEGTNPLSRDIIVGTTSGSERRNWLAFNLAPVAGKTVTSATLTMFAGNGFFGGPGSSETWGLFDYKGSIANLVAGTSGVGTFADLGSGLSYGSLEVFSTVGPISYLTNYLPQFTISLSSAAIADINSANGGDFAIGGALQTLDYLSVRELLWGSSLQKSAGQLNLEYAAAPLETPLPAALPLFASILAGGGLIAWRRKRKAAKVAA